MKNCMTCGTYFSCKSENKGAHWVCDNYFPIEKMHVDDLREQKDIANEQYLEEFSTLNETEIDKKQKSIARQIEAAIQSNSLLPIDLDINDKDFWEAPNYYQWCFSGRGIKFIPFARQMWIALNTFVEACPKCSDHDWLYDITNVPVDYPAKDFPEHFQFFENGVCPRCGYTRSEAIINDDVKDVMEVAIALGQRSGKSVQTAGLASYHIHKLLKTTRPTEYYGLASQSSLTHTYTGLSLGRAFTLLWTPVRNVILDSPWFKDYIRFFQAEGKKLGEELITVKDTYINFRRARLMVAPAAPDVGKLRGDTRAAAAIDELGFFSYGAGSEDLKTISADEIHTSLTNSLATVRTKAAKMLRAGENNVQQGLMFNLSSTKSIFDKIMTLVKISETSRTVLGVRLPTWEVNPDITEQDLNHYRETLGEERFERDFGANPPIGDSPFFDSDDIPPLFGSHGKLNAVTYKYINRLNKKGKEERAAKLVSVRNSSSQPATLLALDAGETNNSFSLAVCVPSLQGTEISSEKISGLPKLSKKAYQKLVLNPELKVPCTVQALIEVIPPQKGRVNFNKMYSNVIAPVIEAFNVQVVVADRWNSILLLDSIADKFNILTLQYSLKYKDFDVIQDMVRNRAVSLPKIEGKFENLVNFEGAQYPYCFQDKPLAHLALQFMTVRDTGRTVTKGSRLTDDSFRAVALGMFFCRNAAFVKEYLSKGVRINSANRGIAAIPESGTATFAALDNNPSAGLGALPGAGSSDSNVFSR